MSALTSGAIAQIRYLQRQAASLLLYQSVLKSPIGQAFLDLLQALHHSDVSGFDCLCAYGKWFKIQAAQNLSWKDYLISQIIKDENPFSRQAQQTDFASLSPGLVEAAKHDLQVLQNLYECSGDQLGKWVRVAGQLEAVPPIWHSETIEENRALPLHSKLENWSSAAENLAVHYRQFGTGLFAEYQAFQWRRGQLTSISHPDRITLKELVCCDWQRDALVKNTEFLLAGYPALHVLLYGSRGAGKSSLVKSLLNEFGDRNLRLIEVPKSDLQDLPLILEQLRGVPQKFIVFVDDLSFEEDDDAFKALKVVLEGNVTARPQNVVVYATSNRRHLIREFFDDRPRPRDGDEVHAWDTVQEKLSFSDRFGLTLTFESIDQNTYLTIVRHLALLAGIKLKPEDLEHRAKEWATRRNGRSGRTARQFVDFLKAELALI
ncbi:MAG: ATP-binding protein [Microcoleus sp. CSU_2_2]|nr:ATP-binding protein [Microcoleus sp. SU_5_3]NJS11020.1 ATP-binding protein [Microcoleus sp. CSU_2_2]